MKIAILSDFHFGYAYNSELENDSFENAEEAMEKALDSDLIILAGDVFDSRVPKTSTWAKAIKILVKPLMRGNNGVRLVSCSKELKKISERTLSHLPLIAIHGTHERRGKDEINVIEALENAGILIHLHQNTIVFEKDGEKIAIHGMSGVPERYAKDVLYNWSPKPVEDCFNILLLHQSIEPFVYSPLEPPSLNLSTLPKGFNLIVDGHLHISGQEKIGSTILLVPGSTIITQNEPKEAAAEKGFFVIDEKLNFNFIKLEKNRKFFYEEIKIESGASTKEQIDNKIKSILSNNFSKPPLIRLKIFGKEEDVFDQDLREIERKYYGQSIITFARELESPEMTKKMEFLKNLREQKLSVEEMGLNILRKNLDELNFCSTFDCDNMFRLLSEGELDNAFNILIGEQRTLKSSDGKRTGLGKWTI